MESGSQPASTTERSTHRFAELVGVVIALLTLTVPLAVIAYYSGGVESSQPVSGRLSRPNR
ncbi:MAG: hypothetical protein RBJ76_11585 [Stenomitos frigidus ULC029]